MINPINNYTVSTPQPVSYAQATALRDESVWHQLERITVRDAVEAWLSTLLNERTRKAYSRALNDLVENDILGLTMTLQQFALINQEGIVDAIKLLDCQWSEATRQLVASAYISLTAFLTRRTGGIIRKAQASKEGHGKTFYRIRDKVTTNAIPHRHAWMKFFEELHLINPRDCLLAKILLQGGKRISEVLSLQIDAIDFAKGEITFIQAKAKGTKRNTVISYSQAIMNQLKEYVGDRTGYAFITKGGKPLAPTQIDRNFAKAGERADLPFRMSPHVLRATCITQLREKGFSDSSIMKVTGHYSSSMIDMYDKSSLSDNASKQINLV